MNPDLIAAGILFGPATMAGAAIGIAALRGHSHHRAIRTVLAESAHARARAVPQDGPPPDGGQPTPAAAPEAMPDGLAQVIAFPHRRVD